MRDPRIVTPEEVSAYVVRSGTREADLAYTVAYEPIRIEAAVTKALEKQRTSLKDQIDGEPDRTRAAVVKALRNQAARLREYCNVEDAEEVESDADAIENGADW